LKDFRLIILQNDQVWIALGSNPGNPVWPDQASTTKQTKMKRVTGLGGAFFKSNDPENLKKWYDLHLGIKSDQYGGMFRWRDFNQPEQVAYTAWGPFSKDTEYFLPSEKPFMFNYRVENLEKLLQILKDEGVKIVGKIEDYEYGKFGWILDPEGNKIELWEPKDANLSGTVSNE
jgi:predicted enzyme related to lactoylglutathione lyase